MKVRSAKVSDVEVIHALINSYAERDQMLFRPLGDIYKNLQAFLVADADREVVGCCALEVVWSDLGEIKSLAVAEGKKGTGVGKMLVDAALGQARRLGLARVFALTLNRSFFEKRGFAVVDKSSLPMKVWSDCARCPKQQHCDEIALVRQL